MVVGLWNQGSAIGTGPVLSLGGSDHLLLAPYGALRPTGVTLLIPHSAISTGLYVSDTSPFQPGQKAEIVDALISEVVQVVSIDSPSTMTVLRGQNGTVANAHGAGKPVYADFSRFDVKIDSVVERPILATLADVLDASIGEASGSVVAQSVDNAQTTIEVSDASVLAGGFNAGVMDPIPATIDGMSFASISNSDTFLGSTGRSVSCDSPAYGADWAVVRCSTLGDTPAFGPTGSGRLATVTLNVPQASGIVNLTLSQVNLAPIDTDPIVGDPPIPVAEVIGGAVSVGGATPPSIPDPTPGLISVWVSQKVTSSAPSTDAAPQQISVDVMANNIPVPSPGHGLGGYEFRLSWDLAGEDIMLTDAKPGYLDDTGIPWDRGITLAGSGMPNPPTTTMPVNDASALQPGWTVEVGSEQMLITSKSGNNVSVIRGYRGTTVAPHASGLGVYAGPERVVATRSLTPGTHAPGSMIKAGTRQLTLSDIAPVSVVSVITVDTERLLVLQKPAWGRATGLGTLSAQITSGQTTFDAAGGIDLAGDIIRVDNETMAVISDAGTSITVKRGMFGTTAVLHASGAAISGLVRQPSKLRVTRAALGTTAAVHLPGATVIDPDGLGSYSATVTGPVDGSVLIRAVADGAFLGSTLRPVTCPTKSTTSSTANIQCNSSGTILGAIGSGQVAAFDASGAGFQPSFGGTATGATTGPPGTLTDTGKAWVPNSLAGRVVTAGGKTMTAASNTPTVITGTTGWSGGGNPGAVAYVLSSVAGFQPSFASTATAATTGPPGTLTDTGRTSDSGVATGATTGPPGTLTDTTKAWATDALVGQIVTAGGKTMTVASNTATVITGSTGWSGGGNPGAVAYTVIKTWVTDSLIGMTVTAGGKTMTVASNTATVITGAAGWSGGGNPGAVAYTVYLATLTKPVTLAGSASDASGENLTATPLNGTVRVVKCPDVTGDRLANFTGDVINLAKGALGLPLGVGIIFSIAKFDIDNNGNVNFTGDVVTAAKVITQGQPLPLRCAP